MGHDPLPAVLVRPVDHISCLSTNHPTPPWLAGRDGGGMGHPRPATSQVAAEEHSESRPCLPYSRPTPSPSFDRQGGRLSDLPP